MRNACYDSLYANIVHLPVISTQEHTVRTSSKPD